MVGASAVHVPGSFGVASPTAAMEVLDVNDETVVYCTSRDCMVSRLLYRALEDAGYDNVRRYSGGVLAWQEAGHPLEGEQVP